MRLYTREEVRKRLEAAVAKAGGQAPFARQIGVTPSAIGNVVSQGAKPGPAITRALGFEAVKDAWRKA